MIKEFEILTDIFAPDGLKCIKKDVMYFKVFETNEMELESFIDAKGKVISKYCGVIYRDKYYKVNTPYAELRDMSKPIVVKGLLDKSTYNEKSKNIKSKTRVRR